MANGNYKTPGVYGREIDISNILIPTGISNGGTVVRSKRGPINRPVLVSNDKEYIQTFGEPIYTSGAGTGQDTKLIPEFGYGAYGALEFLKESSTLFVVRDYDETNDLYAAVTYSSALSITSSTAGISATKLGAGDMHDTSERITGIDDAADGDSNFIISVKGPGTDGNNVAVTIESFSTSADWKFKYDAYPASAAAISGTIPTIVAPWYPIASKVFKMEVYTKANDKDWDDYFANSTERSAGTLRIAPVETWYGTIADGIKDADGNDLFIENVVNGNSQYVYVKKGSNFSASNFSYITATSAMPVREDSTSKYVYYNTASPTSYFGILGGGKTDIPNTEALTSIAGWSLFENKEEISVGILIGSSYDTSVKQEIARIAGKRADCVAVNQTGDLNNNTVTTITDSEAYGYAAPSYVALYGGYSKVYDKYNDKFVYLPNSIFGATIMARVDRIANPWDAPAGIDRATLSVLDQRKIWSFDDIGKVYDKNINLSKFVRGTGYVVWGQKTAQLKNSALDRINVRRNLLYIETNIERNLLPFLFENNTAKTRLRVYNLVDEFLASVQAGGGLTGYKVVCDESNNTSAVIDANQMNVDIYVQPARSIEYIQLTTVITRTGVSFEEVQIATA